MPVETEPVPRAPEMSTRAMVLLGSVMTVGVGLVLGLTLLVGGGSSAGKLEAGAAGTVPQITGFTSNKATSELASRKLAVGGVIQVPSSLPAGQVVRTSPKIGSQVGEGTPILLYVSAGTGGAGGSGKVTVPYLIGVQAPAAQTVARQLGLRLEFTGGGRVTGQDPEPGTSVDRGTAIQVTLQ
ncbi:PASTA domain-containing protein [Actinocorallia longicatena]|uniref:PASTA domain-containing protein n=1 Tax=Actinocorallia longicatena TaxID=111803 RepID=A0ABP6QKJ9_9ACTN